MYIPEPVRALGWHICIAAAVIGGLAALVLFGVAAVLNWGAGVGIVATIVLAVLVTGGTTWWLCGKQRPGM